MDSELEPVKAEFSIHSVIAMGFEGEKQKVAIMVTVMCWWGSSRRYTTEDELARSVLWLVTECWRNSDGAIVWSGFGLEFRSLLSMLSPPTGHYATSEVVRVVSPHRKMERKGDLSGMPSFFPTQSLNNASVTCCADKYIYKKKKREGRRALLMFK